MREQCKKRKLKEPGQLGVAREDRFSLGCIHMDKGVVFRTVRRLRFPIFAKNVSMVSYRHY